MMLRPLVILTGLIAYASEPTIMIGVLEEIPSRYAGEPSFRGVRVAFQRNSSEWRPFPGSCEDQICLKAIASQYPPAMTWTIAFSGRGLGQVTGVTPKGFATYSSIGLQNITSKEPIPTIGKRSAEFGGFIGSPVFRPLIAASRPYFEDPDSWKPSHPSAEVAASLRLAFRKKVPKASNCTSRDQENPKPWQYSDADIKFNKAYSSIHNWSVVEILLAGNRCIAVPADSFIEQWFAVTPRGEPIFLGQGMWLVDVGDYDNDGKSELVFAIDRYNQGGYELFYDDFKRHATFQFSYH
jgi:hypothetical protein